ncbi:MAG: DUF937 domain-containing protein [Ignavibacteria bacterium]|nr:DUF937 domain-containing protein [Ignavibacteria bacterium]
MSDFINDFLNNFGGDASNKIGSSLGIDPGIIQQAIPIIAPMILGGLMKQKQEYGSQDRVDHILNKYGDPGVLNNIDGLVNEKSQLDGDPNHAWFLIGRKVTIDLKSIIGKGHSYMALFFYRHIKSGLHYVPNPSVNFFQLALKVY